MAGQPRRRAMIDALESRTRDFFEFDPVPTHLDYVAAWIEDGHTINELAQELTTSLGFHVHREWIGTYLRKQFTDAAADERLANARAHASHVLAEASIGISDEAATTSVDVARNGLRARSRQWTAAAWNPAQYGQQKATTVSISLGVLHLDALRAHSQVVTGALQPGEIGAQRVIPAQETSS